MKDISYHILDIVQNSLSAGASSIVIELSEDTRKNELKLEISDNGKGMNVDVLLKVTDPFFTTSTTKKVGLGLSLLRQNAEQSGGSFEMTSGENKGTTVTAIFCTDDIDMIPIGDLSMSVRSIVACNPEVDLRIRITKDDAGFELDTAEIRHELGDIRLNRREILDFISDQIRNSLKILAV